MPPWVGRWERIAIDLNNDDDALLIIADIAVAWEECISGEDA
jgi:hypothetical protein